jgi:uncharacterized protein YdaU (DUF1376 family)
VSTKSPAFQFYAQDWLSSVDISLMTLAEEGAYHRLLCWAWTQEDCGLPSDDISLAHLSRLGDDWPKSKDKILRKFRPERGRLYNDRLLAERCKQADWREKSSRGGKNSALNRMRKGGSTTVPTNGQPTHLKGGVSLQSSSSSRTVVPLTNQTHLELRSGDELGKNLVGSFQKIFLGEWVEGTFEVLLASVNTPELVSTFQANTPLWMNTAKYQGGHCKDSRQFVLSGVWKHPPKDSLIKPNGKAPSKPIRWYVDPAEEGKAK